jgi:hypothetical protein
VPAGNRAEYFPVYSFVPKRINDRISGFDLGLERKDLIALARDSGRMMATNAIRLVIEDSDQKGTVVLAPIYAAPLHAATEGIEQRRTDSISFSSMVRPPIPRASPTFTRRVCDRRGRKRRPRRSSRTPRAISTPSSSSIEPGRC